MCPNFLSIKILVLPLPGLMTSRKQFFTSCLFLSFLQHIVVECGELSAPANGSVDLTNGTVFGSKVTYACNTGYILEGNGEQVCQANASWSGTQPTCQQCDSGYAVVENMCSKPETFMFIYVFMIMILTSLLQQCPFQSYNNYKIFQPLIKQDKHIWHDYQKIYILIQKPCTDDTSIPILSL